MRTRFRLALALAVSLALAGAAHSQDEAPQPSFPSLPATMPAGSGIIQPCLDELEGQVRCGRYRVWEDREAKSGRTIDLAFVIADALDPKADHGDAITWFFGGPGSSVTRAAGFLIPFNRRRLE